jgi:small-conductance mechanosensitive channel
MWDQVIRIWNYPLITLADGAVIAVDQIVLVVILLTLGILASRWIERAVGRRLRKAQMQPDAVLAVRRVLFYTLIVIVAITALGLLHVPLTAFAFVSGAVAIGVGFGAQNVVSNFISGWILMSERPVRIGDFVEVEGSQGSIEVVGNRSTRIRRVDGVHMLVPNSQMLERTVINWTLVDKQIRTTVRVGVAYGSPVREVERLIYEAAREHDSIKKSPVPVVIFEDFGDSALIFDLFFWCDVSGERQLREVRSDIRFRLCELFAEHGITIAFPQTDIHLDTQRPLQIELIDKTSAPAVAADRP